MFISKKKYKELKRNVELLQTDIQNKHDENNRKFEHCKSAIKELQLQITMLRNEVDGVAVIDGGTIRIDRNSITGIEITYDVSLYIKGLKVCDIPKEINGEVYLNNYDIYLISENGTYYKLTKIFPDQYGWVLVDKIENNEECKFVCPIKTN